MQCSESYKGVKSTLAEHLIRKWEETIMLWILFIRFFSVKQGWRQGRARGAIALKLPSRVTKDNEKVSLYLVMN